VLDGGLPPGAHPNPEAPLTVRVRDKSRTRFQATRTVERFPLEFALPAAAVTPGAWHVQLSFAYCTEGEQSSCVPASRAWRVAVTVGEGGAQRLSLSVPAGTEVS